MNDSTDIFDGHDDQQSTSFSCEHSPLRRSPRLRSKLGLSASFSNLSVEKKSPNASSDTPRRQKHNVIKRPPTCDITPLRRSCDARLPREEKKEIRTSTLCGLPEDVQNAFFEERKIKQCYEWQVDCLSDSRLLNRQNCVISLPTGAGKTLVAEILMLREATVNHKCSILVLPYVAIVQEKITSLSVFENLYGIRVEEYAGNKGRIPPINRRKDRSIYICTIEKANILLNSMLEQNSVDKVGLVVVDEIHMLSEGQRGTILESLISKFLIAGKAQIVGMSATLSNIHEIANFMKGFVYSTEYRPVELQEFVRLGQEIYVNKNGVLDFYAKLPQNSLEKRGDSEGIAQLLTDIPRKQTIIFCATKKHCESLASMLSRFVPKSVAAHRREEKDVLVRQIETESEVSDGAFAQCIRAGIVWHHAGLTQDERKLIEYGFKERILCVLCATSTLAAGVNLPASRVIIRTPMIGRNFLSKSQYLQMIGRAGRPGCDSTGEAITILKPGLEQQQFLAMLSSPMMSCISALNSASELSAYILDLIALKLASTFAELLQCFKSTLCYVQNTSDAEKIINVAMKHLMEKNMLSIDQSEKLQIAPLGLATFAANMNPADVPRMNSHLVETLSKGLVCNTHFHLLFTISPYDIDCNVDWSLFHSEFSALPPSEKALLALCGTSEGHILRSIQRSIKPAVGSVEIRLYFAMILQHVWRQEPTSIICARFGVERGWLQASVQHAITQAKAIARFAERIDHLWALQLLLPELIKRLQACQQVELVPLLALDYVKQNRAMQLYAAGFKTVADVAKASAVDLCSKIDNLHRAQALKIIQSAKVLFRDEIDARIEEMEKVVGADRAAILQHLN